MARLTFPTFIRAQFKTLPVPPKLNLSGRVVIVTGSNTGLGLEAARHFVSMGPAKLILAVRSLEKGEAAKKSIVESTGCADGVVEVWELDMGSFESVKAFAKRAEGLERLDIVNENAGIATDVWTVTEDGYETTCVVPARDQYGARLNCLRSQPRSQRYQHGLARSPPTSHPPAHRLPSSSPFGIPS